MSDWTICPLSELAEIRVSNVDKKSTPGEKPAQLCNYVDVYSNAYITASLEFMQSTASAVEREKFKVSSGDVIITKDSETPFDIGIPAVVMDDISELVCGYHLALIKPNKDKVNSVYLSKQLASSTIAKYFSRMAAGSTRYGLSNGAIAATAIPLAPKKQQQKIAAILVTLDQAIERTEALIHKYQQIKAGLMHDLFTRGLTADGKLRPPREQAPELYQETPIGWIPKEWKAKKLGDILIDSGGYLQTGPFGSQLHAHEYTHEGVPVVMPQDINDGDISTINIARIPEKRAQILHRHRLKIGDIIIARRGELSRAAAITVVEKTWVCGTGCFLLRLGGSNLDARFFSYAYRHDIVQRQVAGLAVGTTMPSLNNTVMNALYFPYVIIDEQNRIAERLGIVEWQIESLANHTEKLNKQKSGLMHDLLTGKVPVTIDPAAPAHV